MLALIAAVLVFINAAGQQHALRVDGQSVAHAGRYGTHQLTLQLDDGGELTLYVPFVGFCEAANGDRYSETVQRGSLGIVHQAAFDGRLEPRARVGDADASP